MNMKHIITLWSLASALYVAGQPVLPATTRADLAHLQAIAKQQPDARRLVTSAQGRFPIAFMNGSAMVGFLGKLGPGAGTRTATDHIQWGARVGDVISFRVDAYHLEGLGSIPNMAYAELASIVAPMLDKVVRDVRADSVQQGINLPQTYTGRNTILGIMDAGFDYTHPMFYDTAMTATRILAAWDPYKQSGPHPAGYAYGTEFNGASELLAAQCDTMVQGARDIHGTHVAGIAGGGGAGTPYRGMAFDADFLFVSLGPDNAALLDGFAWMRDRAQQEGKKLVINASWGSRDVPMDGTSLFNQAMDQLSDQGVLFVCANGNYGGVACHIGHSFSGDTLRTRAVFSNSSDPFYAGQSLMLWGEVGAPFSASIASTNAGNAVLAQTPWYSTTSGSTFLDSMLLSGNDTLFFTVAYEAAYPTNGRPFMRFTAWRSSTMIKLALRTTSANGTVHAWNDEQYIGGGALGGTEFQGTQPGWTPGDHQCTVIEPACGLSVIGVGAYQAAYVDDQGDAAGGQLAGFSSRGPTMDGRLKPDICAPGVDVVSSVNSFATVSYTPVTSVSFNGHDYPFGLLGGTSMATPVVSGCAALLREAAPNATPAQIKAALMVNARTDNFTGAIPAQGSTVWGLGKVNIYRAIVDLLGVVGISEDDRGSVSLWPNPTADVLHVKRAGTPGPVRYAVVGTDGQLVAQGVLKAPTASFDMRSWASGTYLLIMSEPCGTITRRIVRE